MNETKILPLLEQYYKRPNPELLELIVEQYISLPKLIATRFKGQGVEEDDLFQVASMALLKAIERFNPSLGNKFITYATPTIVGDVKNYIRDKASLIKVGRNVRSIMYNMQKVKERFEQEHYRSPNLQEIANIMNISKSELIKTLVTQSDTTLASLDATLGEDEEDTMQSLIGDMDPGFLDIDNTSFMDWVQNHTSEQEFKLLQLRFVDTLSQREVAKQLNISQMQVSRLEKRIFTRLRTLAIKENI